MNVTVIGMGYVGQSTAAAFSKIGYCIFDVLEDKI